MSNKETRKEDLDMRTLPFTIEQMLLFFEVLQSLLGRPKDGVL